MSKYPDISATNYYNVKYTCRVLQKNFLVKK